MAGLLIFIVVLGVAVALVAQAWGLVTPPTAKPQRTTGQKIAMGIAIALGAVGLGVAGFIAFVLVSMNNWANNK